MLVIRDAQLAALRSAADERYCREVVPLLRRQCPRAVDGRSDDQVACQAGEALRLAARYGITDARGVLDFVLLSFLIGPRFDAHPAFAAILTDPGIPGDRKIPNLFERVESARWEAASARAQGS